jgi:hypothetical protein
MCFDDAVNTCDTATAYKREGNHETDQSRRTSPEIAQKAGQVPIMCVLDLSADDQNRQSNDRQ